jgi:hypothetical protein
MTETLVRKKITYTYTLPSGAAVVIFGVPALCDEESEDGFCAFEPEVVDRLSELIDIGAAKNPAPGEVVPLNYANQSHTKPEVDLELHIKGSGIRLGEISINVLQKLLDNAASAFRIAANAVAQKLELPPPPQVAFLAPGSVVIGLRSRGEKPLFSPHTDPGRMALDLVLQGIEWVKTGVPDDVDPNLAIAAIEGAKQLSPGPRENFRVELIQYEEGRPKRTLQLDADFKSKGSRVIEDLAARVMHKRVVVFEGLLDQIKLDGPAHLRRLKEKPHDYTGQVLAFEYPESLLGKLLSNFGKNIRVVVEEHEIGQGKHYTALDVEAENEEQQSLG